MHPRAGSVFCKIIGGWAFFSAGMWAGWRASKGLRGIFGGRVSEGSRGTKGSRGIFGGRVSEGSRGIFGKLAVCPRGIVSRGGGLGTSSLNFYFSFLI